MYKSNLLNAPLTAVLAEMGHTDQLVVADAGLPIPTTVERIDLAVIPGLPGFMDLVRVILENFQVESAVIAEEIETKSPHLYQELRSALGDVPVQKVPHKQFKEQTVSARAVVRTGEFTPYANVILVAGVRF